jgi:hypothetical protein
VACSGYLSDWKTLQQIKTSFPIREIMAAALALVSILEDSKTLGRQLINGHRWRVFVLVSKSVGRETISYTTLIKLAITADL